MKFHVWMAVAAGVLSFLPASALAQGKQDFALTNRTGYTISEVYVAPTKSDEWEEDVLGLDVLNNGERVEIGFPWREDTCTYDLKVVFDDGDEAEWRKFNLCEVSRITIYYDRYSGETTAEYD